MLTLSKSDNPFTIFASAMETTKKDIRALSKEQLREFFITQDDKEFRGNQVYEWLWSKGAHKFEDMTNISKETRQMLEANFVINHIEVDEMQRSNDGTIKNGIRLHDGLIVESVLIPTKTRTTACVSSQVGCSLDCKFCATSRLKRMRNLNPDEIFDQVVAIDKQSRLYFNRPLSNIVFMGMGEPLMNFNNVLKAIDKITSPEGLGTSIMPFNATFPLADLREALEHWYAKTKNTITYEYVVWDGINDTKKDVEALIQFCKFAPSKVNLIEYNPIDDGQFKQADSAALDMYISMLEANNITVTVRRSRGKDIDAACGQLANKS